MHHKKNAQSPCSISCSCSASITSTCTCSQADLLRCSPLSRGAAEHARWRCVVPSTVKHATASTCRQYSDAQISPPGHSSLSQQADLFSEGQADRAVTTAPCEHAQGRTMITGRMIVLYPHAACLQHSNALQHRVPPHTPGIKAYAAATVLPPSRAHTRTHKSSRARSTQSSTCSNINIQVNNTSMQGWAAQVLPLMHVHVQMQHRNGNAVMSKQQQQVGTATPSITYM